VLGVWPAIEMHASRVRCNLDAFLLSALACLSAFFASRKLLCAADFCLNASARLSDASSSDDDSLSSELSLSSSSSSLSSS
jgi:hypothetical protein